MLKKALSKRIGCCLRSLVVAVSYFVVFLRYPALHGSCVPGDEISCTADQLHDHLVTYHTPLHCKYLLYVALVAKSVSTNLVLVEDNSNFQLAAV